MIDIKDINDNVKASVKVTAKAIYHKELMSEEYVLLSFDSDKLLNLTHGDYIDCEFGRFYIVNIDKPVSASNGGYTYEQKFNAGWERWSKFLLFYDRQKGFEKSWKLTSFVENFMNIIVSNLKEAGFGTFTYTIDSTVNHVMKLVEFDGTDIISALTKIAEAWETEWWITDNIIHIGYCSIGTPVDIRRGDIITDMRASDSQDTDYITRLYAFGSTRNIPKDYRKDEDGNLVIEGVVERRLKMPEGTDHVDAWDNLAEEEIVEGVAIFDDIYPHRIGTIASITTKEYTDTTENEDGTTTSAKWNAFRFTDTGITFSDDYRIESQDLHIIFQTGSLAGMDFVVSFNPDKLREDDPASQLWEIIRNDTYGIKLPNDTMKPKVGDTYVLYGYDTKFVSDTLIPEAEQELLKQAQELVKKKSGDKSIYEMPSNPVRCAGYKKVDGKLTYNVSDVIDFDIGQAVTLYNDVYFKGGSRTTRIRAFEKRLDNKYNCTYTAGEASSYSRSKELEQKVSELTFQSNTFVSGGGTSIYVIKRYDRTTPSDYNVFSALKTLATCLRKDQEDRTAYMISLNGGANIGNRAKFGEYITGVSGGYIDEKGDAELNSLYLRSRLFVPVIAYNKIQYFKGQNVISPGGGMDVKSFVDNKDGSYTITPDITDADGISFEVDDILTTSFIFRNSEGKFAGFELRKFRVTTVDTEKKTFTIIPKPDTGWAPADLMQLCQTGNFTNTERQTYMILDTINGNNCITFYDNANTWDTEPAQVKSWLGKKKGMEIQGINLDNYSGVFQNVFVSGLFYQFDSITGGMIRVPIDKGAWKAGKYAYYDRVTHNGSLWLCVNEKGTSVEPSDSSADWLKQVAQGQQGLPGNDGLSVIGGGHWQSSNTPYKKNTLVEFANCVFMSKADTNQPPMPLITTQTGSYLTTQDGGYLILSRTVNPDWEMYLDARPLQGRSITFLGEFATPPANPSEGDSYRNTTDKCTYIYKNGTWMVMTQDGTDGKDGKDYEWIYTRTNTMMPPEKPKSEQTDDYVPTGWTDDMAGVDEEHQLEWACKRTKVNGTWSDWSTPAITSRWSKDGESVIMADLDNEMAGIPLTYEDKTNKAYTLTTNVWMSYGLTKLTLTNLTASGPAGWTMTADKATGKVTVTIPSNVAVADTNNVVITLTAQNSGQNYSRTLTFTVLGSKAGAPGEDAVVYSLVISASNIKRDKKGVYTPTSITASKQKTQGNAIIPDTPDGELKYSIDGGAETVYTAAIDATKVTKNIKFNLYVGGKLADTETVPLIIDGTDGAAGKGVKSVDVWYYLSTSNTSQAGGTWATTPPKWEKGKWYWQKTITTYTDNTTSESKPSLIPNGGDGVGVKAVTEQYYLSTSPTAQTGGEWTDTRPGGNSGKYIWTRSVITYTNGTVTYTAGVCITGNDGASVSNLGHWHTGLHVPYLGIVRMGKSSYMCNVQGGTDNPPVFTLTTQTGSRLTTQDGGYLLTGLINTDEYEIVATDGEDGKDGESIKGDPGAPGEDAVTADLTNEMMTVPLSSEGKTTAVWSDTSQAMMYVGVSRATITKIETIGLDAFSVTGSGDTFTVAAKANTAIPDSTRGTVNITGTYNGKTYTRYCGISITGVKAGEDAVYYKLLVSPSSVLKDASGNVSTDRVSCTRFKVHGGKMTETTDGTFTVYKDNGSGSDISGSSASIDLNTFTKSVRFVLIVNGSTADEETVFIVEDGSVVDFVGHWQSANVPYKKNKAVRFGGATYVALRDTSNPPMPLLTIQTGSYLTTQNGGYLIAALSLNSDWRLMAQDGQNGKDGTDGMNGDDAVAYSLECPISVINYNSVGTPTPSAFVVTLKKTVGKNVSNASDLYLVSRGYNYNGVWADGSTPTKTGTINVQARVGYTQFAVRAYVSQSDAQAWNNNYVCEKGIGVSQDGSTGATLIDRGLFANGQKYYWNATERDKVVWAIGGTYYNFLVKNYGATVTAAPSSPTGDSNWEAMNYMRNIITDALFADQANIAGFTFNCSLDLTTGKYTKAIMASQNKRSDGTSNTTINGVTGEINTNKLIAIDANITGIIKATSGRIAGFMIDGNTLKNQDDNGGYTNDATVLFRNDMNKTYAAIGGNVLPSVAGFAAVARFDNKYTSYANLHGGINYAMLVSAQGAENNVAIALSGGYISGMAYKVQIIGNSSSIVKIDKEVGVILLVNTTTVTIKLPDMDVFDDGHMIKIKRLSGKDQDGIVSITPGTGTFQDGTSKGNYIVFDTGGWTRSLQIGSPGDAMELVYVRNLELNSTNLYKGAWVQFKNPRDW